MRLPQEIYDLIIDHLHNDKPSLRCCALVSRGWVYRSQAQIFYFLAFGDKLLRRWLNTFSPTNERIHSLVKVLILYPSFDSFGDFMRLAEYAPAFKNVEHLLINGRGSPYGTRQFPCIRWFSHLRDTLKTMKLEGVVADPRIIAGFPRLKFLLVGCSRLPSVHDTDEGDDIPTESDLRDAFKGSLEFDIYSWNFEVGRFVTAFADCPLGYDTIKIGVKSTGGKEFSRLISRCSNTLEVLHLNFKSERLHTGLNFSPLKRLREISLALAADCGQNLYLPRFSTITSGTMSKITITVKLGSQVKDLYGLFGKGYDWSDIDEDLLRLVESQAGDNAPRVELVVDIRSVNLGLPDPSGRERKTYKRNWWIYRASKYAFPKFSQAGTINFILFPPSALQ